MDIPTSEPDDSVSKVMVPGGGRPTTARGGTMALTTRDPITYPTGKPVEAGASFYGGLKRLTELVCLNGSLYIQSLCGEVFL
jgi:hypothetical protein